MPIRNGCFGNDVAARASANGKRVPIMAVNVEELTEIERVLSAPHADGHLIAELRRRFAHLSWIRCDASDVTETPYRSYAGFDLHLLDGADHCAHVTADPARATGIILAMRKPA